MSVYDLDALADYYVAEDGKEREDGWKGRLAVDDPEGNIVHLEAVGQVSDALSAGIGVCYDDDFVSAIDEFLDSLGEDIERKLGVGLHLRAGTCGSPLLL
jgi:hypothetical protein